MYQTPHEKLTVYLSGSWDTLHANTNLFIASLLAQSGLIVIGDHPSRPSERGMRYAERVNEHLRNCAGIVLIFPYRASYKQSTSSPMFVELLLAAKYRLPMLILLEEGVVLQEQIGEAETTLAFGSAPESTVRFDAIKENLSDARLNTFNASSIIHNASVIVFPTPQLVDTLVVPSSSLFKRMGSDVGLRPAIETFLQSLLRPSSLQHVFHISPYNMQRERTIVAEVVFGITGLRSVNASDAWAGAPFASEKDIASQIANSLLVLADLTGNRPACVFEAGCAVGGGRPPSILRAKTPDKLPFGLGKMRLFEYENDEELRTATTQCCWPFRRRVFNTELEEGGWNVDADISQQNKAGLRLGAQLELMTNTVLPRLAEAAQTKHVIFQGPVGAYVEGGQVHSVNTHQNINNLPEIESLIAEISKRRHELALSTDEAKSFEETLHNLEASLRHANPESGVVREHLTSLKHIFEHAAGAMLAHGGPIWLPALIHQIASIVNSIR